jgi:hypothetical protein
MRIKHPCIASYKRLWVQFPPGQPFPRLSLGAGAWGCRSPMLEGGADFSSLVRAADFPPNKRYDDGQT